MTDDAALILKTKIRQFVDSGTPVEALRILFPHSDEVIQSVLDSAGVNLETRVRQDMFERKTEPSVNPLEPAVRRQMETPASQPEMLPFSDESLQDFVRRKMALPPRSEQQ